MGVDEHVGNPVWGVVSPQQRCNQLEGSMSDLWNQTDQPMDHGGEVLGCLPMILFHPGFPLHRLELGATLLDAWRQLLANGMPWAKRDALGKPAVG